MNISSGRKARLDTYTVLRSISISEGIVSSVTSAPIQSYESSLIEEAVRQAVRRRYEKTMTRVLRLEHLLAIMLQAYRPKDKTRMTHLLDVATVDKDSFKRILRSHGLERKWQEFRRHFYGD